MCKDIGVQKFPFVQGLYSTLRSSPLPLLALIWQALRTFRGRISCRDDHVISFLSRLRWVSLLPPAFLMMSPAEYESSLRVDGVFRPSRYAFPTTHPSRAITMIPYFVTCCVEIRFFPKLKQSSQLSVSRVVVWWLFGTVHISTRPIFGAPFSGSRFLMILNESGLMMICRNVGWEGKRCPVGP